MKPTIVQNSPQHISAVANIDMTHNRILEEKRRDFKLSHPGVIFDDSEDWLSIQMDNESRRQCEHDSLKKRIIDMQPVCRPKPEPLPEAMPVEPSVQAEEVAGLIPEVAVEDLSPAQP